MLTGKVPLCAVLRDGQSMAARDMPPEHLAAPAAFEANHVVPVNGSPDRHCGYSLSVEFGCRFAKARERLMNGRDQRPELVGPDLVVADICSNNVGRAFSVERRRRYFVWHLGSPYRCRQNTMSGKIETRISGSPLGITPLCAPPFGSSRPNRPPAEFCRIDLGGRKRDIQR